MTVLSYVIVAAVALAVTLAVTPVVRRLTERRGPVDEPGGRKVPTRRLSRLGGVGIFAGCMAGLVVQYAGEMFLGFPHVLRSGGWELVGTLAGMVVIFAVARCRAERQGTRYGVAN